MTNHECAMSILAKHREARKWDDGAVTSDLLKQLGLDPKGEAKNPTPVVDPEEAEVALAEAHAREMMDKAKAARAKLDAQKGPEKEQPKPPAPPQQQAPAPLAPPPPAPRVPQQQAPTPPPPAPQVPQPPMTGPTPPLPPPAQPPSPMQATEGKPVA